MTDEYYAEDSKSRERTFSEGSAIRGQQHKEVHHMRRRKMSPNNQNLDYDESVDEHDGLTRHNTIPRGTRYYMPETESTIRRMSPRRPHQNYDK
jgi:hypothetical protein